MTWLYSTTKLVSSGTWLYKILDPKVGDALWFSFYILDAIIDIQGAKNAKSAGDESKEEWLRSRAVATLELAKKYLDALAKSGGIDAEQAEEAKKAIDYAIEAINIGGYDAALFTLYGNMRALARGV